MKNVKLILVALLFTAIGQILYAHTFPYYALPFVPNYNSAYVSNYINGSAQGTQDAIYVFENYYHEVPGHSAGGGPFGVGTTINGSSYVPLAGNEQSAISFWQGYLQNVQNSYNNSLSSGDSAIIETQRGILEAFHKKMIQQDVEHGITYYGMICTYLTCN